MRIAIIIIFLLMASVVASKFLDEFKAKRWNEDYILLKSLIYDSDINKESYLVILQEFDNLDWNTEIEHRMKQSLYMDFEIRFKEVSTHKI